MDFMRLLKSLDDLLYEVVGWVIFYPLTMIRTLIHPVAMLHYSNQELLKAEDEQYSDTLNPPIFLLITLFLAYVTTKVFTVSEAAKLPGFLSNDSNLLLFRGITFSIFPVLMAMRLLRHQRKPVNRSVLRAPFYGQCFIAAPFALAVSVAGLAVQTHHIPYMLGGLAIFLIALIWYVLVEVAWFSQDLRISKVRATVEVLIMVGITNAVVLLVALLLHSVSGKT